MSLIGIILLIGIIYFVVRPMFRVYHTFHSFKNQARDAFNQQQQGFGNDEWSNSAEQPHTQPRKKVFSKEDGEYVDFEEITDETVTEEKKD